MQYYSVYILKCFFHWFFKHSPCCSKWRFCTKIWICLYSSTWNWPYL